MSGKKDRKLSYISWLRIICIIYFYVTLLGDKSYISLANFNPLSFFHLVIFHFSEN